MSLHYQYKPCCTLVDWYLHLWADVSDSLWLTVWNDFLYSPKVLSVCFHLRILNQSPTTPPPPHIHTPRPIHAHTHTHNAHGHSCDVKNSFLSSFKVDASLPTVIDLRLIAPCNEEIFNFCKPATTRLPQLWFWIKQGWWTWLYYLVLLCWIIPSIFSP